MRSILHHPICKWLLVGAALAGIALTAFTTMARVPINSDFANHVLEGQDWIGGNFFLKDWVLTGISFLTTELPFYGLSAALLGVQPFAYVLAEAMILTVFLWFGLLLLRDRVDALTPLDALLYYGIAVVATVEKTGHFRGHTAAFAAALVIMAIAARILTDGKTSWGWATALLIVTAIGVTGDFLIVVIAVLPVVLLCGWELMNETPRFGRMRCVRVIALTSVGSGAGVGLDRLYFSVGGAVKNQILSRKNFTALDQIGMNWNRFAQGVVELMNGTTRQTPITALSTLRWIAAAVLIIGMVLVVIETIYAYLKRRHQDLFAVLLALSMAVMAAVCVFTDVLVTSEFTRYISFLPVFTAILIVRRVNHRNIPQRRIGGWLSMRVGLALVAALLIAVNFPPLTFGRPDTRFDRVAAYLVENGYRFGFAHYWNASSVTVSSHDQVKIRAITVHRDSDLVPVYAEEQRWFYKPGWFSEAPYTFVLLDDWGYLDVSEDSIITLFGEPAKVDRFEGYEILVYKENLVPKLIGR